MNSLIPLLLSAERQAILARLTTEDLNKFADEITEYLDELRRAA